MDKNKRIEIGQRLQKAREHRGLSVVELSELVEEYSPKQIQQFEAGKRELDVNGFATFCFALETDMDWLLSGVSSKELYGVESSFATYYGEGSEPVKH